ncbi:Arginase/agmatinase/formiminoglutamase [Trichormus variabilis ATCC 29413]|uniref:Arginase/agmatinase/formiminoglutamase n=2 Tax=Anabaena variabilis TaxID=264691 RepID=Q3MGY3_TRIV2|nr:MULTISPECIES: agmatinase SpeB [Nostocaceae]ABA19753.1 Arginase/agmatinase/formiminoglutamase [Trichormus variabilis ATCC 29413]MBC1217285.1 agmatinase family protein [Trichormus variabilis ARAD]MBC1256368.1 agmatinase family protein [Trichormus variabilis V5]MBC1269457.1 agmatinase family protein [Trichormus variabilis FSR]MBC1303052.1 agmatinase family protein [Trichormus variabilis N2B]
MINQLQDYNPSGVGEINGNLLGLPCDYDSANLIVFAVPWEVTVSYGAGTANGPQRILDASVQLDLFDFDHPDGWKQGIFLVEIPQEIIEKNNYYRDLAAQIIERLAQGKLLTDTPDLTPVLTEINQASQQVNQWLFTQCQVAMNQGKQVAVIGGDHSSPLGYFQALSAKYPNFGILHIDAHADLRDAYEGFEFSHASIMFNGLKLPQISKLVQVGLRDISHDEVQMIDESHGRIVAYYDPMIKQKLYGGTNWIELSREIVNHLPEYVHISFDVDGLDPKLCPNTGTPVPGGLELEQVFCLFRELVNSGRKIIGFDVCEVGDGEWDGNVGARVVYKLANLMDLSHKQ